MEQWEQHDACIDAAESRKRKSIDICSKKFFREGKNFFSFFIRRDVERKIWGSLPLSPPNRRGTLSPSLWGGFRRGHFMEYRDTGWWFALVEGWSGVARRCTLARVTHVREACRVPARAAGLAMRIRSWGWDDRAALARYVHSCEGRKGFQWCRELGYS